MRRPGAEQITVEAAVGHVELLEVRKSAPFRRDSTGELVGVVAVFTKVEHLERNWKLLGQFSCNKVKISSKTCNAYVYV